MYKLIGWVFIVGMFGVAAIDGALLIVVVAVIVSIVTSMVCHNTAAITSDAIASTTKEEIDRWAAATVDEKGVKLTREELAERKQTAKALYAKLEAQTKKDRYGNNAIANMMGIGAFAAPILGIGYLIGNLYARYKK